MTQVSIIIPTLYPNPNLENYATSLSLYPAVGEVIIVVNTCGADRDENTVHWRFLGKNKGYTGACNVGARVATGELLLFLNDDCDMSEDALQKMVGFLEQNSDVVATQPIVKKQVPSPPVNGTSKSQVPTTTQTNVKEIPNQVRDDTGVIENIGFWIDTRIGKANTVTVISDSKQQHQDIKEGSLHPRNARSRDDRLPFPSTFNLQPSTNVYGLSGTCLLIRKDIFEKVGMWDESFHSYLEDVDLAIRLHKAGYKMAPCLDAEVIHEHMATSSKMGLYKEKQDVKNWWRLIFKHPDVFIRNANIFPLLIERARNLSGLFKKILRRVIYFDKLSMT